MFLKFNLKSAFTVANHDVRTMNRPTLATVVINISGGDSGQSWREIFSFIPIERASPFEVEGWGPSPIDSVWVHRPP